MKTLFITLFLFTAQNASAVTLSGVDTYGQPCEIYVEDESSSVDGQGQHVFFMNARFSDFDFNGVLAAQKSAAEFSFTNVMMRDGWRSYTRVIGAPITVGGVGVLDFSGVLLMGEEPTFSAKAKGNAAFAWWKKSYFCHNLKSI